MPSLTGKTFGHYRLIEQIGRGGMASVFKAYDPRHDRYVALKVIAPTLAEDPRFSKRFVREAKVVLQVKHPHIVPMWDFGIAEGYFYSVMPYLPVGSLAERLQRGPLTPSESSRLMSQVCAALEHAHSQGVVHRDIKPSNILLDEEGNAMLTDFGLAQIQDATLSLTGSALLGTPAYVSPEQARGDPVDARTDQYSLGIILFQLATGELPFNGDTPMAIALKHMQEPLPKPRQVNPRVPETLERIILKATAKDPHDRFPSMAALNEAFQAALAHALDPSQPIPRITVPPSAERTAPIPAAAPERRRRLPVWVGALAVLVLLVPVIALAAPGIVEIISPQASEPSSAPIGPADSLQATIDALSTQLAGSFGDEPLSDDQLSTAIAGTLAAQGALPTGGQGFAFQLGEHTATPTGLSTGLGESGSPTRTPTSGGGGGPGPSATPTRTASATTAPPDSPTSTPTSTLPPTPTRTATPAPPTNTSGPPPTIDPAKCKPPDHPVFGCTPTPGP